MSDTPDTLPYTLHLGDCIEVMRAMPDNSVDSIVTDPPYELGFMGKSWDASGIAYSVELWREALRVLKPGGHLLAFSGSRTYHRMACAIEDAGFQIRDQAMWMYGSGFPKSLDVSKAIDKARTEDIEPTRVICRAIRAAMDERGMKSRDLAPSFGDCHPRLIDHWAARDTDSQPSLPTWEQWQLLRTILPLSTDLDAEVWRLNGRKGSPGDTYQNAEIIGQHDGATPGFTGMRFGAADTSIREPSGAARQWEGWGTALKPAHEPICVARKPLVGTVAANVLQFGTGALNIDGCRVPLDGDYKCKANGRPSQTGLGDNYDPAKANQPDTAGRWPANIIHDGSPEVVALFPANAGAAAPVHKRNGDTARNSYGAFAGNVDEAGSTFHGDTGSAARFFYCAKASKSDRGQDNIHPTVKPIDLMAFLVRLVTPPGGTVLDPFMGSGSTGKGAVREGFNFVGIDMTPEYVDISRRRIADEYARVQEVARQAPPVLPQLDLFKEVQA